MVLFYLAFFFFCFVCRFKEFFSPAIRFDYKLKSFIYVWCRKSFFFSLHSRAHSHLSNWINKKKRTNNCMHWIFMINKKLKRNQLFSSLKTFLKDVLTFDLNQIINWYYVCTYDVFFISHFNLKTICSLKHFSVVSHIQSVLLLHDS